MKKGKRKIQPGRIALIARANPHNKLASFFREPSDKVPQEASDIMRIVDPHPVTSSDREYTVQWDNVTFEDRYIVIKGVVPRKTVEIFYKSARASFNSLKWKLRPFRIQISNKQAKILDSTYMDEIIGVLEQELDKTPLLKVQAGNNDGEYTIQWENVTFENKRLKIERIARIGTIYVPLYQSRESFNFIKKRISQRLKPFRIRRNNGLWKILDDVYMQEIVKYLECKDSLEQMIDSGEFDYQDYYTHIPPHLSDLFFPKDKKEYLDVLCELQSDDHKIIPALEMIGTTIEDSFLFTVKKKGSMYIIWENTNLSRATYVFRIDPAWYEERLQFVFDYIVGDIRAKRRRLHSDNIDKDFFGEYTGGNFSCTILCFHFCALTLLFASSYLVLL